MKMLDEPCDSRFLKTAGSSWRNGTPGTTNGAQMDCACQPHTELDTTFGMKENGSHCHSEI